MSKLFSSFLAAFLLPAYLFAVCDSQFTTDAVNDTVCLGSVVTFTDQSSTSGNQNLSQWNFGDLTPAANGEVVSHIYTTTGTFTVGHTIADDAGCTNGFISHTIVVIPPPGVQTGSVNPTCFDDCNGTATVFITNGPHNDYMIEWDDPDNQDTQTAVGLCDDTYTVTVSDIYGCSITSGNIVLVEPAELLVDAGEDIFICVTEQYTISDATASGGTQPYTYSWEPLGAGLDFPDSLNPVLTANVNSYGTLFLTVMDDQGCIASDEVDVSMTLATINGIISIGPTPGTHVEAGEVYLYKVGAPVEEWQLLDTYDLLPGGGGFYEFLNVPLNDVIILAKPDSELYPYLVPTYYDFPDGDEGEFEWDSAFQIQMDCGMFYLKNIELIQVDTLEGTCNFEGHVYWRTTGKTLSGDPIPFIDVVVKKTPPGNAIVYDDTNGEGQFNFAGIEVGNTYTFVVNVPGLTMVDNYPIVVTIDDSLYQNLDFYVDTTDGAGGIFVTDPLGIDNLKHERQEILAYPNPFSSECEFRFPNESNGEFSFLLFDLTGKLITKTDNLSGDSYLFKTETLEQGIYFAEVRTAENVFRSRVMKK